MEQMTEQITPVWAPLQIAVMTLLVAAFVPITHDNSSTPARLQQDQTAPVAVAPDPTATLALAQDQHHRLFLDIGIGGRGPFPFLVDTGSETTIISQELAEQLSLAVAGQAQIMGISGPVEVETVGLHRVGIGRIRLAYLEAPVLLESDIGARGILGVNSLQGTRVIFDFARDELQLSAARANVLEHDYDLVLEATKRQQRLIFTNARIDGIPVRVVVDTGTNMTIGNEALRRRLAQSRPDSGRATLKDVLGADAPARVMSANNLVISGLRMHNSVLAFADAPAFEMLGLENRPALLLGMNHLRRFDRVSIDFVHNEVAFDFPNEREQAAAIVPNAGNLR